MGLNSDMQSLIDNIKHPLVFYLSRSLFENATQKDLKPLEDLGLFNTLVLMNHKGEPKVISNALQYAQLSEKNKILKTNVFELLELRSKLDKKAFHYLIDEYFKELNNWIVIMDSVREKAKTEANNYKPYMQDYLEHQYETLKTHQKELKDHFGEWKTWFELERVFKLSPYDLDKGEYKNNLKPPLKTTNKEIADKTKTHSTAKESIISEADVDRHLLKSVFNVDFSKIDSEKM
ncbi:hypothetical protein [uncultured Winogradskyella sp.]|uniref:hypothetical protein n=1 Tax=uncultured Winogradskyella sp. TaxID=395353 RepID=UPI00260CF93E|nr:hypothetical protein [uncultured Winogradskyella sp.]